MNARHCCQIMTRDRAITLLGSRRAGDVGVRSPGGSLQAPTLVLLPNCPACMAMYVTLFSGVGISVASASKLRTALLIVCVAALFCMAVKRLCRLASQSKALELANSISRQ